VLRVRGDEQRLSQVLCNLAINAVEHTGRGTHVTVGARDAGDHAALWVEDDGPGLEPEVLLHLFERSVRGRTTRARGSGLGLSITKALVEAHDGTVRASSELGRGTRFDIALPAVLR
jgi:signal transduction histidine kinase